MAGYITFVFSFGITSLTKAICNLFQKIGTTLNEKIGVFQTTVICFSTAVYDRVRDCAPLGILDMEEREE
ncbi:hypothetical protein J6590_027264 [Homalodisca vitripennis]|nr:hypothetical protein J6590_027264 [Homalodisca vitripennis]